MTQNDIYDNPLIIRYASPTMVAALVAAGKFSTWRRLWVALAEAQRSLGLKITRRADRRACAARSTRSISSGQCLREAVSARRDGSHSRPRRRRAGRSADHSPGGDELFVTDNADLILMRQALELVRDKTVAAIDALAAFAEQWKDFPCLGYTHFQPAQLVTVGKRATLWCHELVLDLEEIERRLAGAQVPGGEGDHRHSGELPGAIRR